MSISHTSKGRYKYTIMLICQVVRFLMQKDYFNLITVCEYKQGKCNKFLVSKETVVQL